MKARAKSYLWVSWLPPLIAGEGMCVWKPWAQAHYYVEKVERDDQNFADWQARHTRMVHDRAAEFFRDGYDPVTIEDQNKFTLKGKTIDVGGKIDVLACRESDGAVVVSDEKSGKRKDSHVWQVRLYLYAIPYVFPHLAQQSISGEVCYKDGRVTVDLTDESSAQLVSWLQQMGSSTAPATVPSAQECQWCPISGKSCPDRVTDGQVSAEGESSEF